MKERLSVYLDRQVMRSLTEYADRRHKSKSLVAEAAIVSFLSPDASERDEATFVRRLDRLSRRIGFRRAAEAQVAVARPLVKLQLEAYVAGLNEGTTRGASHPARRSTGAGP